MHSAILYRELILENDRGNNQDWMRGINLRKVSLGRSFPFSLLNQIGVSVMTMLEISHHGWTYFSYSDADIAHCQISVVSNQTEQYFSYLKIC